MNKSALPLLIFILSVNICYVQIIIDQKNTYITSLSEAETVAAKQTLHFAYGHITKAIKLENILEYLEVNDTTLTYESNVRFNTQNDMAVTGSLSETIENNANTTFIVGNSIRFQPGFHAQEGSYVDTHITTTGSFCDDLPAPIVVTEPVDEENQPEPDSPGAAMKVFLNPNNGQFTLISQKKEMPECVSVCNAIGQKIKDSIKIKDLQFYMNGEKPEYMLLFQHDQIKKLY